MGYSLAKAAKRLNCLPMHQQKYFLIFSWTEIHKIALYDYREGVVDQSGTGVVPIRCSSLRKLPQTISVYYLCHTFMEEFINII